MVDVTAPESCGAWGASLLWLPPGYRANLIAWCETQFPTSYTMDQLNLYSCIRREVQEGIDDIDSAHPGFTSDVASLVAGTPLYDPNEVREMYDQLLNGISGHPFSVAEKFREIFLGAYDTCCCAVSPGKFLAWLSATPAEIDSDIVQANTILFGVCEDRSKMGDADTTIDG